MVSPNVASSKYRCVITYYIFLSLYCSLFSVFSSLFVSPFFRSVFFKQGSFSEFHLLFSTSLTNFEGLYETLQTIFSFFPFYDFIESPPSFLLNSGTSTTRTPFSRLHCVRLAELACSPFEF